MNQPISKDEMMEYLRNERNNIRTVAGRMPPNIYTKFRKKCIDMGIEYQAGLEKAIKLWLSENQKTA